MRISDWSSDVCSSDLIKMMLTAFSNMETVHIAAYSHLLDTIGMPERESGMFLEYDEMRAKHDYMGPFGVDDEIGRAHDCTSVTNAQLVCPLLLYNKKKTSTTTPPPTTPTTHTKPIIH